MASDWPVDVEVHNALLQHNGRARVRAVRAGLDTTRNGLVIEESVDVGFSLAVDFQKIKMLLDPARPSVLAVRVYDGEKTVKKAGQNDLLLIVWVPEALPERTSKQWANATHDFREVFQASRQKDLVVTRLKDLTYEAFLREAREVPRQANPVQKLREAEAEHDRLRLQLERMRKAVDAPTAFYATCHAITPETQDARIPLHGAADHHCFQMISDYHELDTREKLNTSSYVNVVFEEKELEAAELGLKINLADQTVYPESFKAHNKVLNMVANLWHCPVPSDFAETGAFAGAGTVGSTEACLLGGLCLKFRWRHWYAKRHGLAESKVRAVRPNLVISTCFQAAWEKLFRYMDVKPKFVKPSWKTMTLSAEDVRNAVDEQTMGVVCILGNHYAGQYDPVWEIDAMLKELNKEKGWQVGIHVDAASGGFVAPFQDDLPPWDFRLDSVLSISSSGHKFGESVCGTGWVVWRGREGLSEHVAISVSYLGGHADSYTLNFSRPASGVFVQYYKFHRLGKKGYRQMSDNRMQNAAYLRSHLMAMKQPDGRPTFTRLDAGDKLCLPVVTAMLNPELNLCYDDIDFQHMLQQRHWYVSGYAMSFHNPNSEETESLFNDVDQEQTMFRVVVKANMTRSLVESLVESITETLSDLDAIALGFLNLHDKEDPEELMMTRYVSAKQAMKRHSGAQPMWSVVVHGQEGSEGTANVHARATQDDPEEEGEEEEEPTTARTSAKQALKRRTVGARMIRPKAAC